MSKLEKVLIIIIVGLFGFMAASEGYQMGYFQGQGYMMEADRTGSTLEAGDYTIMIPGAPFETLYHKWSSAGNADTLVKQFLDAEGAWVTIDSIIVTSDTLTQAWNVTTSAQVVADEIRYGRRSGSSTSVQLERQAWNTSAR